MFYDVALSKDDKKELAEAAKQTERRVKQLARENRENLNSILGRLSEKYDVEFSPIESFSTRHMPLGINLTDKAVEVPLDDWGSGTQNRTHVLMAVLQANRIKTTESPEDKITPLIVVEEPESFLHPSAQAEFGKVLRTLSSDLGIQIITTTHSPYMLNQENPSSNILLCRESKRGKRFDTKVLDTAGDNWMAPFSEHLGLEPGEFNSWRPIFSAYRSRVLLVEGKTDKEYFEFMQKNKLDAEALSADIEIVPYEGKDTLRNTLLVQFVLSKFDRVFITCDLDAIGEVKSSLQRLGLKDNQDFLALGIDKSGRDAVEGLLPERILAAVNGRETDLVMRLGSRDTKERNDAKSKLKKKYLEEFIKFTNYTKDELKDLSKAIKVINAGLSRPNKPIQRTR
jgi:predicted ATP-dependent endonuclease of OLD family